MFSPLKWYLEISNLIKSNNPDIDTSIGTVVGDISVLPLSVLYEKSDIVAQTLLKITNLDDLAAAISDASFVADLAIALETTDQQAQTLLINILNNIATDYGLVRLPAAQAIGTVYYALKPATNFNGIYNITTSERIQSIFNFWYRPIQNFTFNIDSTDINKSIERYYVPEIGTYAFPVIVQCETTGSGGNIAANQIYFTALGSPSQFDYVTNLTGISGGRAVETDTELVARIKSKWEGSNLGTKGGYNKVFSDNSITDTYISGIGDPYMKRDTNGGAVDAYLRSYQGISITVTGVPLTNGVYPAVQEYAVKDLMVSDDFLLTLPVHEVIATPTAGQTPAIPVGFDYIVRLIPDSGELYGKSARANDKISVTANTAIPATYLYDLQFVYNYHMDSMQTLFAGTDYQVLGQDLMLREPWPKDVKMTFMVKSNGVTSLAALQTTIQNTVISFINAKPLGSSVAQSDIVNIVEDIAGVDLVYIPFQVYNYVGDSGAVETSLAATPIEYLQIGSFAFPQYFRVVTSPTGGLLPVAPDATPITYYYTVIAEDVNGNLTATAERYHLTITAPNGKNTLYWDAVPNAVSYTVWRGTTPNTPAKYFPATTNTTFVDDGGVLPTTGVFPDVTRETAVSLIQVTAQ